MNHFLFTLFLLFSTNLSSAQEWITPITDDTTLRHNDSWNLTMVDKHGGDGYFVAFDIEGHRSIPFEDTTYEYTDRSAIRINSYDETGSFEWTKTFNLYETMGQDTAFYKIAGVKMLKIKDYYILITPLIINANLKYVDNPNDTLPAQIQWTYYSNSFSHMIMLDDAMNIINKAVVPFIFSDIYFSTETQKFHFIATHYNIEGTWHEPYDIRSYANCLGDFSNLADIEFNHIPKLYRGLKFYNGENLEYRDSASITLFKKYDKHSELKLAEFLFNNKNHGNIVGSLGTIWGNNTTEAFSYPNGNIGIFYSKYPDRTYVLFDNDGDTISTLLIENFNLVWIGSYVYSESGGILMYGMVRQTFMSQCFIIEFDHEGKFLWRKQFYVDDNWPPNRIEDLQIVGDKLVLVVSTKGTSFFPIEEQKAWLVGIGRYGETSEIHQITTHESKLQMSVPYPNPGNGLVWIKLHEGYTSGTLLTHKIYNSEGRMVLSVNSRATDHRLLINLSGQNPGIYFIKLITEDGKVETVKMIKL